MMGCHIRKIEHSDSEVLNTTNYPYLTCTIEAINLSEDMSIVSSKNDEICFFIYQNTDSGFKQPSIYRHNAIYDKTHYIHSFRITQPSLKSVTLVMIEEDSDRSIQVIDSIVANNLDSLKVFHIKEDYTNIRRILGDDDVLSMVELPEITTQTRYSIFGIHKMDKYEYAVTFK